MAATFEDAIRVAIKTYFEKSDDFDKFESNKERKYNKKYFDGVKDEFISKKDDSKELEKKLDSKSKKGPKY